jgi:hypothetical protein
LSDNLAEDMQLLPQLRILSRQLLHLPLQRLLLLFERPAGAV